MIEFRPPADAPTTTKNPGRSSAVSIILSCSNTYALKGYCSTVEPGIERLDFESGFGVMLPSYPGRAAELSYPGI